METTVQGFRFSRVHKYVQIMENQLRNNMGNEMETGLMKGHPIPLSCWLLVYTRSRVLGSAFSVFWD